MVADPNLTANQPNNMKTVNLIFAIALTALFSLPTGWGLSEVEAQNIGISTTGATPNASALLDVDAAPGNNKGLLVPRVALTGTGDITTIASAANSLLVYNTATAGVSPNNVLPGYYYWNGTKWISLSGGTGGLDWSLLGNAGTVDGTNFIGTTDNISFNIRVNNQKAGRIDPSGSTFLGYLAGNVNTDPKNTGIGYNALTLNITGFENTAVGYNALGSNTGNYNSAVGSGTLQSNTTGASNTGIGWNVLASNTTGNYNTAMGERALASNTTGSNNTAVGLNTLISSTTGSSNTAIGWYSLFSNTTGSNNTGVGQGALQANTTGIYNTGIGLNALNANTTGSVNTAIGMNSLFSNTIGQWNTAVGYGALYSNIDANNNTAVGMHALRYNVSGSSNTATGYQSLENNTAGPNCAYGFYALRANTTGTNNVAMGDWVHYYNTTGSNNVAIGSSALYGVSGLSTGSNNTAIGFHSLYSNTTGNYNTATGWQTLLSNTGGSYNIALGYQALQSNSSGSENSALGGNALINNTIGNSNIAIGAASLRDNITGSTNTALGYYAGVYGTSHNQCVFIGGNTALNTNRTNVTAIGYAISEGFCTGDNQVLLGNGAIVQIRAQVTGITAYSDARFKTNIKENIVGLDFILKLKPVTYNVRPVELHKIWGTPDSLVSRIDHSEAEKETRIGFVAQDVEKAAKESGFSFPGIDVPRNEHEVYTLRYVDFIMPMVKAIQELKAENDSLKSENATLKAANDKQQTTINTLTERVNKIEILLSAEAKKQ